MNLPNYLKRRWEKSLLFSEKPSNLDPGSWIRWFTSVQQPNDGRPFNFFVGKNMGPTLTIPGMIGMWNISSLRFAGSVAGSKYPKLFPKWWWIPWWWIPWVPRIRLKNHQQKTHSKFFRFSQLHEWNLTNGIRILPYVKKSYILQNTVLIF